MREKYETLSVAILRDLAKARNMKHISGLKKSELIDAMVAQDELDRQEKEAAEEKGRQDRKETAAPAEKSRPERKESVTPAEKGRQDRRGRERVRTRQDSAAYEAPAAGEPQRGYTREPARSQEPEPQRSYTREPARSQEPEPQRGYARETARSQEFEPQRGYGREPARSQEFEPQRSYEREPARNQEPEQQRENTRPRGRETTRDRQGPPVDLASLDSGNSATGILEIMADGYGFLRSDNYLPGENDVYVAPSQIRKFNLKTGDIVTGNTRIRAQQEKYSALLYIQSINGYAPADALRRNQFEDMTPIFPNERLRMERGPRDVAMRIVDLISPVGKGQRGMIVSPPKAGKTTLLKEMATSILRNDPDMHIIIMLIDERPEEVTDIREAIVGDNVTVLYSTFDELPEHHRRVAEMGIERAKRLVEYGHDVTILLDSITRLARAYNLIVSPSGRTLSGGLDPAALNMPKRFFGAARNMREGGSLTILATALVDTGSKMDDVVYEEFKGTGNMELVLDRKLSERRVFPAIDIQKSGTRREDLLLDPAEMEAVFIMRRALNGMKSDEAVENILNMFVHTRDNAELVSRIRRQRFI